MTRFASALPSRLALAALLTLIASGCDPGPFGSPEKVGLVLDAVTAAAPEARSFLARTADDAGTGAVEVFVDLSLSMQPYLADAQASVLRRVLVGMSNDLGGDVAFRGFGFEPDSAAQTVSAMPVGALLTPAPYTRVNNDYGALFERFAPDSTGLGPVRVVFTDGVESDPEGGAMFGRIVGAADRYVRAGGTFAVLIWRAPYAGRYYSEGAACPRGAFEMACPDRPLVAFVFAPTAGQLRRAHGRVRRGRPARAHDPRRRARRPHRGRRRRAGRQPQTARHGPAQAAHRRGGRLRARHRRPRLGAARAAARATSR